jgi:broad specificity phosphatase PhoE
MLATAILACVAFQPTEIVYVRHAETMANATGKYNSRTLNAFSSRGEQQVTKATRGLAGQKFDAIVVSPSPRALKTIAPYLRSIGDKAEVWPELYECCHQPKSHRGKPASPKMRFGERISWDRSLDGLFTLRPDNDRLILAPTYLDGMRQIKQCHAKLIAEFGGTGKRVLVVGHSIVGGHLISMLTGGSRVQVENAAPIRLIEVSRGKFELAKKISSRI